jgi:hypothetical protein
MNNETREKAIKLAASYFANWKYYAAALEPDEERRYSDKYDGAVRMAALIGIDEKEIEDAAWALYGDEIRSAYEANNATW